MSHSANIIDTDKHYIINPNNRSISRDSTEESSEVIAQYDHKSERLTFELPRYVDSHDMSKCGKIKVYYRNIDTYGRKIQKGCYRVSDMMIDDSGENILFSWLIHDNATQYVGTLKFSIRFICEVGNVVDYIWNTNLYSGLKVVESIYNDGEIEETDNSGIVTTTAALDTAILDTMKLA